MNPKEYSKKIVYQIGLLLSFVFPHILRRNSKYNGTLYIALKEGRKVLETAHANYSFASLHRIMRFVFKEVPIQNQDEILLLGLGGGSAINIVRKELKKENKIVVVDIDPVIVEIAKTEFRLDTYSNLEVICQDASEFVAKSSRKFGIIIIDLWIDNHVPDIFFEPTFLGNILGLLGPKGQIVFNMFIYNMEKEKHDKVIQFFADNNLETKTYEKVGRTNWLVIAKR